MKNKNRRAIIEKLKELDMEKTDFKALPFYSLLSFHDSWYKWFELASKAKKAAQLITMVKDSFVHSKPSLHKSNPEHFNFLKWFYLNPLNQSSIFLTKSNCEKATTRSNDVFSNFTKD